MPIGLRQVRLINQFLDQSPKTMMMRRLFYLILAISTAGLLLLISGQQVAFSGTSQCSGRGVVIAQINNPQPQVTGDRPMKSFTLLEMPNHWQKLVGVDQQGQCFDYIEHQVNYVTLSAFLPIELATDLVSQRWSKLSATVAESSITASVQNPDAWLAPEDALALYRLGYQIPAMAKVLPTLSPYQFDAAK
jgi:hypothetical protein